MTHRISTKSLIIFLSISVMGLLFSCSKKQEPADLVLTNGKIVTVDETKPEAEALASREGVIIAVGSTSEIEPYIGRTTKVIDLEGKLAIPGFIDSHVHFTGIGQSKLQLDLTKVKSWDEIIAMVEEAVAKAQPGEWILGRGWHQEKWDKTPVPDVDGLPFHHELSVVSPENPVLLNHASGHSSFANDEYHEWRQTCR